MTRNGAWVVSLAMIACQPDAEAVGPPGTTTEVGTAATAAGTAMDSASGNEIRPPSAISSRFTIYCQIYPAL